MIDTAETLTEIAVTLVEGGKVLNVCIDRDQSSIIKDIFSEENQLILRKCSLGSPNRVRIKYTLGLRTLLVHTIFFSDGRIFDSTRWNWRESVEPE